MAQKKVQVVDIDALGELSSTTVLFGDGRWAEIAFSETDPVFTGWIEGTPADDILNDIYDEVLGAFIVTSE